MPFPFAMNLRDLGGLRSRDGRRVAAGKLYRTGNLGNLDAAQAAQLVERIGLATYYDFRVDHEVAVEGAPLTLQAAGVRWVQLPVDSFDPDFGKQRTPAIEHWVELYLKVFAQNRPIWLTLFRAAAEAERPLCFGCAAGKDRTGIAAGALLRCLGVEDEDILADYARTTPEMLTHVQRFARHFGPPKRTQEEFVAHFLTAARPILAGFLAGVDQRFGGPEAALVDAGLEPSVIEALRARYLE